jgi:hypothetical protein
MKEKNLKVLSGKELMQYIELCSKNGDSKEMMRAYRTLIILNGEDPDDFSDIDSKLNEPKPSLPRISKEKIGIGIILLAVVVVLLLSEF